MELALNPFIGTALIIAAELSYYVQRRRPISVTTEASSAVSRLFALSRAVKSWEKEYTDIYDEAA